MKLARLVILTVSVLSVCGVARASSPAEEKKACVAASTEGQIARDEGRLLEAREQLLLCARDECPAIVRKSCGEWLADVEERIPSVVVRVRDQGGQDVTDATLSIDGEIVPLDGRPVMLNPGPHELVVSAGGTTSEKKVLLAEKEKARLIDLTGGYPVAPAASAAPAEDAEPAPEKSSYKVPVGAWVLGGVGIAGLAAFTYFGLSAKGDRDDLDKCAPGCTDDEVSDGKRNAMIADISLGVGAAALVGGVTWALVGWKRSKSESTPSVSLAPSRTGGMATISGRF